MERELFVSAYNFWNSLSAFDKWALGIVIPAVVGVLWKFCHELHVASTNCIPHIAASTEKTNELLTELNGFIKGFVEASRHNDPQP